MAKRRLFDPQNAITAIKGIVANVVTGLVLLIPAGIATMLINQQDMLVLGRAIQVGAFVFGLWFWGYLVNAWYNWK